MHRSIATESPRRTGQPPRRRARAQLAVLAIAITAALAAGLGHVLPAEAAEHPAGVTTAAHAEAAAAARTDADTASTSAAGTSAASTTSGPDARIPHRIGAGSWSGDPHGGPWVDIPASAWPILRAVATGTAAASSCGAPGNSWLLCRSAVVIAWVQHHPACPGDGTFRLSTREGDGYCR